ncbi:MAG: isochorismate synthase [Pseudanabaenaceae cyanobacterium SKYGB_i_bin29]|nr:isochorismate synthase [Pseudanabaenaceae cyanobacterium SKYG29]MDW8422139.1 isochorismate synthase [Pseudanabaenaceae cyanobacterium SKYGB_i_bin29]
MNPDLVEVVRWAWEKAQRHNCKVLVNYTENYTIGDVISFVAAQRTDKRFIWQRGKHYLAGGGQLWALAGGGLQDWRHSIEALTGQWQGSCPPYWIGYLSFRQGGESCLWLPQWLVKDEQLLLWEWVLPRSSWQTVVERLQSRLKLLRQGVAKKLTVGGGSAQVVVNDFVPWCQIVKQALAAIEREELVKVVLSRAVEVVGTEPFCPFGLLQQLGAVSEDCTLFLLEGKGGRTFVGATPEMLLQFRWQQDRLWLSSDALAGSSRRGEALLQSKKDMQEHQIVIDSILSAYRSVGAAVADIPSPRIKELRDLQHLYTPLQGQWLTTSWLDVFQLLAALHPTAAVGGKPKDRALQFIAQGEPWDRESYAAPIGWVNGWGEGEFAVAIRSGYVSGNRVKLFAGAGIVRDSQVEKEWEETNLKLLGMLRALGLAE